MTPPLALVMPGLILIGAFVALVILAGVLLRGTVGGHGPGRHSPGGSPRPDRGSRDPRRGGLGLVLPRRLLMPAERLSRGAVHPFRARTELALVAASGSRHPADAEVVP